jgi:predicted dehydrogenase
MTTSSRTKIGLIGAGWWATANHLPVLVERDDIDLASVCRLGADELQQVKEKFGFTHATQDYRELLETPGLKGVIVASPHTLHYEHALAALKKGLHVMCEKPLTTRADQARELVEEADKQGVELMIPYGWHYGEFKYKGRTLKYYDYVRRNSRRRISLTIPSRSFASVLKPFAAP